MKQKDLVPSFYPCYPPFNLPASLERRNRDKTVWIIMISPRLPDGVALLLLITFTFA